MKITIKTSAKEFEMQNYVLGQALACILTLSNGNGFSDEQVATTQAFRKKLLKAFLKTTDR